MALPDEVEDLWTWRGRRYLLRAVDADDYRRHMRVRSPKWGTVALPHARFRELVRPFRYFINRPEPPLEEIISPRFQHSDF